jgi:hypothetical protein
MTDSTLVKRPPSPQSTRYVFENFRIELLPPKSGSTVPLNHVLFVGGRNIRHFSAPLVGEVSREGATKGGTEAACTSLRINPIGLGVVVATQRGCAPSLNPNIA